LEIAERIGKAAFDFNLLFAIVVTIIGLALIANGINPGEKVTGLFMPIDWVYRSTIEVQQGLPQDWSDIEVTAGLSLVGIIGIFFQFLFTMLFGFLLLVYTISTILPPQLYFLSVPLFFIGAFVQLMSWIYAISLVYDKVTQLIPFFRK